MDRNSEARYGAVAQIEKPRSNWDRDFNYKTTFNVGDIVPFYFDMDIIPGTTIKNTTSMVIRMNTPLTPIMDNLYVDTYWFKCSKFWYWDHFRAMMGENSSGAWAQTIDYEEPYITTNGNESAGDLACYLGVRQKTAGQKWSKMAANCYIDIYNQWFRDQNLIAPIQYDTTDTNLSADGTINTGFGLLKAAKFHDYMTSLLPQPQKGAAVQSPIGVSANVSIGANGTMSFTPQGTTTPRGMVVNKYGLGDTTISANGNQKILKLWDPDDDLGQDVSLLSYNGGLKGIADLSNAVAATINAQRLAFATQRILERDSMNGTRYSELLGAHYGSYPDDESLLRPEYLGGRREPINITQIVQNSSTDATSPLGYTGAMSLTAIQNEDFTKSFTKDDILVGLMVVRYTHSYQQGLPRQLTRKGRLDRYWPEFAHLGNMPVYNYEIFSQGASVVDAQGKIVDNQVFGYKEAWQEYMYKSNMITGELNSDFATSLDYWHLGDDYSSLPVLSQSWIEEDKDTVDRVLAVQSSTHHQLFADVYVQQNVTAPIPLHRVPGLIDHF